MDKKHFWTLRYTLINVTYFAAFCTVHAYAAVYLLDRGFKAVLFDLDGTLLDTAPDILAAWVGTTVRLGLASPEESLRRYRIGPPLTEILAELVPGCGEELRRRALCTFGEIYDGSGFPNTRLYPGIPDLLAELRAAGTELFVATNKRLTPTKLIIEKSGLAGCFRELWALPATEGARNKDEMVAILLARHGIDPRRAALVGDTAGDIHAARSNDISAVGVDWGYGSVDELEAAGADVILGERDLREERHGK